MQPTYLPWIGYFDLMNRSDLFIFLDNVQFEKRSWQQRNKIKTVNGELILTIPVKTKGKYDQKIIEASIDNTQNFKSKHIKAIKNAYGKSQYFDFYFSEFENIIMNSNDSLADLNISLIKWLARKFSIECKTEKASNFNFSGKKVELLINICNHFNATHYLSPMGSKDYIDQNNLFIENNISLKYQKITHPIYNQRFEKFLPFISAIDLLFNEGKRSSSIINKIINK